MTEQKKPRKNRASRIEFDRRMCKACAICVDLCPSHALKNDEFGRPQVADLDACTACMVCVDRCPDLAIEIFKAEKKEGGDGNG